jgi:hypothetical protein
LNYAILKEAINLVESDAEIAEIDQQFSLLPVAAANAQVNDSPITPISTCNFYDATEDDDSRFSSETALNLMV